MCHSPLAKEGWTRYQEKYREASFDGADGVVAHKLKLSLSDHPVCATSGASRLCLNGAATPPLQGRNGYEPHY